MDNGRFKDKKPNIKIYCESGIGEEDIKEVLLGIEEEGIPYDINYIALNDATKIGYKGSVESVLGVGIGIDRENIVLHYNKLKEDRPIFKIKLKSKATQKRSLGANAARLVTKMPFKEIDSLG